MDPTALLIGLVVLLLIAIIAAILGAKTWNVLQTVFVFLIFVAALGFWYLAAATLHIHKRYREEAKSLEAKIQTTGQQIEVLKHGTEDAEMLARMDVEGAHVAQGLDRLHNELHKLLIDRGRVWIDCQSEDIAEDGSVRVTVGSPTPHRIEKDSVLFAFEQGEPKDGAAYLGEFKAREVAEGTVTLQPGVQMREFELKRLRDSRAKGTVWSLYEFMPVDRHDIFADTQEARLRELLPPESIDEYLKDGRPANPDDPPDRVLGLKADGKLAAPNEQDQVVERIYVRELRDYSGLYHGLHKQWFVELNTLHQLQTDQALLKVALEQLRSDNRSRESEKGRLEEDHEKFSEELALVTRHRDAVATLAAKLRSRLDTVRARNRRLASQLAQRQLDLARQIDRLTGTVPAEPAIDLRPPFP